MFGCKLLCIQGFLRLVFFALGRSFLFCICRVAVIKNQVEIAIIGGGLIGMLTAYALVKSGARVVIIEKSASALESSWAGGGILSPLYPWRYPDAVNALAFESQALYSSLVDDIFRESELDPEYWRCGMHILAEDIDSFAFDWLKKNQIPFTRNVSPSWNEVEGRAFFYLPEIAQVRNPRFIKSLKWALEKSGVIFSFNNAVSSFKKQAAGEFVLVTEKGEWCARNVVVCAGAWTEKLLSSQKVNSSSVDIKPVRGQMLLYKMPEVDEKIRTISSIILAKEKYIIPRKDGHVLVGSTMESVGFNKGTTREGELAMQAFVADVCPELLRYPVVRHWSGLRPSSPDGTPFIGEHPEIPGLYINSGHFRNGVVMAPASAQLMCDLLLGNTPKINPSAYALAF